MNVRLTDKQKINVSGSRSMFEIMQRILLRENKVDQEKEHFWLISLATNNLILSIELISLGSVDATVVKPMNVFRVAVMKGAVKSILCHNHPSGNTMPSPEDKGITDRLFQVGRILNIEVVDHLIISTESYLSFADTGLLATIAESKEWVPAYEIEEDIRKEEAQIRALAVEEARLEEKLKGAEQLLEAQKEKEKALSTAAKEAEKEKKLAVKKTEEETSKKKEAEFTEKMIQTAKNLIEKGVDVEIIIKSTGLSKAEIEKLSDVND